MDPLQFEDLKSKLGPQPTTVGELKLDSYRSPIKTKIIAVTASRKTKEVIEINDSESPSADEDNHKVVENARCESRGQPPSPSQDNHRQKCVETDKKHKKLLPQCQLCKASTQKVTMKFCLDCHSSFQMACIQHEQCLAARYQCEHCRFKKEAEERSKELAKMAEEGAESARRERRREELERGLQSFAERYPYYWQQSRVRFPIEDKLLFIYRQLFQLSQGPRPQPNSHPLISPQLLGDMLEIENFFATFEEELQEPGQLPPINKDTLFLKLNCLGIDPTYSALLECCFKLYLSDIFEKNKTDNIRSLSEHSFFALLNLLNDNDDLSRHFLALAAQEIIRYFANIPSLQKAFRNFAYPASLDLRAKVYILTHLIQGMSEVAEFKNLIGSKSDKIQQLTRRRGDLIAQLKKDQAQSLSNNEELKSIAKAGQQEGSEKTTKMISSKEQEKQRRKALKLSNQKERSRQAILEIRSQIDQISRQMPFITTKVIFLGVDRNRSEYFFNCSEPHRIYVKLNNYYLDQSQNYYFYESKVVILELLKSLTNKGSHERHLIESITSLIKDNLIQDSSVKEAITVRVQGVQEDYSNKQEANLPGESDDGKKESGKDHSNAESILPGINYETVYGLLCDIQEKFSSYLCMRNYQWASETTREVTMGNIQSLTDIQQLKEAIRNLQESFLFVQCLSVGEPPSKNYEQFQSELPETHRKRIPVRLWGINSEKSKRYWLQYLQQCIDITGLWICVYVFKNNVQRYVKKKVEALCEQQLKEQKHQAARQKEIDKTRLKIRLRKFSRSRSRSREPERTKNTRRNRETRRDTGRDTETYNHRDEGYRGKDRESAQWQRQAREDSSESDSEVDLARRPNLRERKRKRMNIQSDNESESAGEADSSSSNEDRCEICGEYGEMICCDTCPKVFHITCLKIKEVPEGDWSCVKCLQRMSNERQTRSRVKRMACQ